MTAAAVTATAAVMLIAAALSGVDARVHGLLSTHEFQSMDAAAPTSSPYAAGACSNGRPCADTALDNLAPYCE